MVFARVELAFSCTRALRLCFLRVQFRSIKLTILGVSKVHSPLNRFLNSIKLQKTFKNTVKKLQSDYKTLTIQYNAIP